jgi:hypothetical protein
MTEISSWIKSLELEVREISNNQIKFAEYFTPSNKGDYSWI